ncbi:serine/threonine-protein kinase [Actinokineospora bangkokensis]|uniref:non-specific serine/threonine protein kinase n=1 Tax=Actinokineospora bangkokensis TaxID=1193682 RepID=A0A1Q9LF18_9PSEU|nr:serine/threonine-protein kinase [Actinokineospora bangkokensis]OLR90559.1 serine/threonine protein kinase [Actinokineospora bangkokensis]
MTSEQTTVAGRYQLGARIGAGAMGVVWQAHDSRLHRTVAIKQLLAQPGVSEELNEEARLRAMREGRIAARLAHPNAITVYDVVEQDGDPWLVMEYLPSKSLAAVLGERDVLPPAEVARIGAQVAAALVAAHAAGIVHRDVKPANVLLGEDGNTVKITDFGISRATGDVTVTATGMLAGTPAYLAPEVAKGEQPTSAADVFSLGSTLYTAVEGHSPFGLSENTLALLYAVAAGKVTPPRQAGPLTALLMQLLRADPTERPTMTEARDALAAVAEGRPLPSAALAHQRTEPHPKPRPLAATTALPPGPRVVPPGTPPHGHPAAPHGTRLDVHPFAEPKPSGPVPVRPPDTPRGAVPPPQRRAQAQQPTGGQRPRQRPAATRPPAKRDTRNVVLTVLAIIAAILVGILGASLVNGGRKASSQQDGAGLTAPTTTSRAQAQQATTTSAKAKATTTTTEATTTTTTTTTKAGPSSGDSESAVRAYYGNLPGNPQAAWQLLSERAQKKTGDFEKFKRFYDRMDQVDLRAVQGDGNRVAAQVHFKTRDGKDTVEPYLYTVVDDGGTFKIDTYQQGKSED